MKKKTINWLINLSAIPLLFFFCFILYFFIVSVKIYEAFGLEYSAVLILLPKIFILSYIHFLIFAVFFCFISIYRGLFVVIFPIFTIFFFSIYIVQFLSLYYINEYIIPEAYFHFEDARLLINTRISLLLGTAAILVFTGASFFSIKMASVKPRGKLKPFWTVAMARSFAALILFSTMAIPGFLLDFPKKIASSHQTQWETPHTAFLSVVHNLFLGSDELKKPNLPLDLQEWLNKKFGFNYNIEAEYPHIKDWIWKAELPFKKKQSAGDDPNIILFLIESLSERYLKSGEHHGITPNISNFSKFSMSINGYYNHTFPTINGIRGQLCSYYPFLGENDYSDHDLVNIKLLGLPEILNSKGYDTIFFSYFNDFYSPNPGHIINMRSLFRECGFSSLFMADDIQEHLVGKDGLRELGKNRKPSVNDLGIMVDIVRYLKKRENKKTPFMLSTITCGTHIGPKNSEKEILHMLSNFDQAFGVFWDYFKSSPFYNNTIVVLTADHSMPPAVGYRKLIQDKRVSFFDKTVCKIFDQRFNLPATFESVSSSLDLTPSILQLAGINGVKNSFHGLSLFSDRLSYPAIICTTRNRIYVKDKEGIDEISVRGNPDVIKDYLSVSESIDESKEKQILGLKSWFAFNYYLNIHNRIWNDIFHHRN